jgi:spermidine/putrescine transport system ATP-binding protein
MTAVFVTHDQEEAFALSDRIAVMSRGVLQQLDTPESLYASPANAFVAAFLGRANFLPATTEPGDGQTLAVRLAAGPVWGVRAAADGQVPKTGEAVRVMARPESLRISRGDGTGDAIRGRVLDRRFAGSLTFYRVAANDGSELLVQASTSDADSGDEVAVSLADGAVPLVFPPDASR